MKLFNRKKRRDQYLLDVKVHTEERTRRRVHVGLGVLLLVAVLAATGWGMWRLQGIAAERLVTENQRFAITRIDATSDGALTRQQIIQFAGVRRDQNLFALDLQAVRRNLETIPLVRQVEVRRLLPGRLVIVVSERTVAARLQSAGRAATEEMYWIDRTGVVMKPMKLADGKVLQPQAPKFVPLLTGVTGADLRVGRPVESPQIYRALELLDRIEQSGAAGVLDVEQIDLANLHQLVLRTRTHQVVRFDVADFPRQLRRLAMIISWAQEKKKTVQTVDLTVSRGVPVTFVN